MVWEKPKYVAVKKANSFFVSVSHPCNEKNIAKSMTILKLCERSFKWDLAGCPNSIRLEMALGWRQVVKNLEIYYVILRGYLYSNITRPDTRHNNYGKIKKTNYLFVNVSHPSSEKNIAKSMTILKICESSFKWDLAGWSSSIRLEMALEWRQVVKNLEIHYATYMGYLYFNIKTKRIELEICSWRHFKENSKLFKLIMDIM